MSDTEQAVVDDAAVLEEEKASRDAAVAEATAAVETEQAEQVAAAAQADADEASSLEVDRAAAQASVAAAMETERKERVAEEEANQAASKAAEEAAAAEATASAEAAAEVARKERMDEEAANLAASNAAEAAAAAESRAAAEAAANVAREEAKAEPKRKRASIATLAVKKAVSTGEPLQDSLGRLTDRKCGINYVMVTVEGKRGTKLKVRDEGSGGFAEMLGKLDEKKVYFIGMEIKAVDERSVESVRTKYVVATYIGPKAPMMKKAGASTIKAKLTQAWGGISIYYQVADLEDFTTHDLAQRLLQCGGAHKPTYYDFGDGTKYNLDFYAEHAHGGA